MTPSDRRRGGGGSHVLRSGSTRSNNGRTGAIGKEKENISGTPSTSTSTTNTMPTVPPRAAVTNANPASPDDAHETSSLSDRKDKDTDGHRKGKDGKDKDIVGNAGGSTSPVRGAGAGAGSKGKQREAMILLRERDDRIAHLETEMNIMESEFTKELDRLSQNESETATFWQAKHSNLNQQFLRTDTELRLLRSEVDVRNAEREELRQEWDMLRRERDMLRHELKERDEEARSLRSQIRGLKDFVSISTRTDGQTSDEVFVDGMTRLGNGLQNWVIVNFRRAKMDLTAAETTLAELGDLVPTFEQLMHTSKVHLLQSIVSSVLVDMVFNPYFAGLSEEQTENFRKMEELLQSLTTSDEPVNQWRSNTLTLVRREATQRLSKETTTLTEAVIERINRLLDAATALGTEASEQRDTALRVLVNNSIELARRLAVQKAVLRVYMPKILPHQRVPFEAETMEDIGGEDEDELAGREICCVAFPGIIKHGDESGGQLQFRNVITKARVICSPED